MCACTCVRWGWGVWWGVCIALTCRDVPAWAVTCAQGVFNTCVLYGTVPLCVECGDLRAACANTQGVETPTYLSVFDLQHGSSARPAPHRRVPGCAVPLTYVILLRLCGYRCPANLCERWESPDFLQLEAVLRQTKRMEAAKKFVAGPQDRRFQSENGAPFSGSKTCPRC